MDTDSAHFLIHQRNIIDNVDIHLQKEFKQYFNNHFDTGNKISGIWVEEGFFNTAEYIGEKCYRLYNNHDSNYTIHMKGLNQTFQKEYHTKNIDIKKILLFHTTFFLNLQIF
jgi:hypothetical protein